MHAIAVSNVVDMAIILFSLDICTFECLYALYRHSDMCLFIPLHFVILFYKYYDELFAQK